MKRTCTLTILACLLSLVAGLSPLHGQSSRWEFDGFELEVRELFPARADAAWSGIEVILTNTGTERLEPTIEILTTTPGMSLPRAVRFSTVVSPGQERRRFLPVCNLAGERWVPSMGAKIVVTEDGVERKPLDETRPLEMTLAREQHWQWSGGNNARWFAWSSFDVLVVSNGTEPEGWRDSLEDDVRLATRDLDAYDVEFRSLSVDALPVHVEAYQGLDRLVLIGLPPERLGDRQREILRAAVQLGLTVWIVPDTNGTGNGWVWPERLLALPPTTLTTINGEGRPFFVVGADLEPGTVRTDEDLPDATEPVPITVRYRAGAGQWIRVTSPVGPWEGTFLEAPRENWSGQVLRHVLEDQSSGSRSNRGFRGGGQPNWITAIDQIYRRSINAEMLFFFVVVYLLVAGPGLFIFLKRKGRLPWLLWMQPAVVAVFLLATGLLGWVHFGVGSRTDDTLILYVHEDDPGGVLVHLESVYSAVSSRRDVRSDDGGLPIPVPAAVRNQPLAWSLDPEETGLDGFRTRTWSLTHFLSLRGVDIGSVELASHTSGDPVVVNQLPFALLGLTCRQGSRFYAKEHVDPGETGRPEVTLGRNPEAARIVPGSADVESNAEWSALRETLWQWVENRTDLSVRAVAGFDPSRLPDSVRPTELSDSARGFVVIVGKVANR